MQTGFFFQKLIIVKGQIRSCRVEDGPKFNKACMHVYQADKSKEAFENSHFFPKKNSRRATFIREIRVSGSNLIIK